ncbi:two component response regulator [Sinorhizobium americanum]|uniref:Two component response regulator n=2 Tax=Sinorhizobium americanum TaxID=194963 RepID=A0A1L3LL16_9HYPH|nr:two component response regulator [Sinorhizobium americanum CCGM7]APG90774.1 two component response regulator [Sinorhizobium americanum]
MTRNPNEDFPMPIMPDNDNSPEEPLVFVIIGRAYENDRDEGGVEIHVMLRAPDDDTAVREALNALAEEGFFQADLDQIGTLTDIPDEEPHASAYQGALEGEVSIIRFG